MPYSTLFKMATTWGLARPGAGLRAPLIVAHQFPELGDLLSKVLGPAVRDTCQLPRRKWMIEEKGIGYDRIE